MTVGIQKVSERTVRQRLGEPNLASRRRPATSPECLRHDFTLPEIIITAVKIYLPISPDLACGLQMVIKEYGEDQKSVL